VVKSALGRNMFEEYTKQVHCMDILKSWTIAPQP
jgi:hypothetical protein